MADRSEIYEWLRIAELSQKWPHLKSIHDHAMKSLERAAEEHKIPAPKQQDKPWLEASLAGSAQSVPTRSARELPRTAPVRTGT